MKRLLLILALVLVSCTSNQNTAATGTLTGHVTIGPINPVERAGETPTPPPEVYAARQVVIYNQSGKREVARAPIDSDGTYRITLAPGEYLVDINRIGIDSAVGLPQAVTIQADQVTRLDIDIDTGIR